MRRWVVAGGLLHDERGLLLVANRRRGGGIDWSTPGGVVDEGETTLQALTREVHEETGLLVANWSRIAWTTEVEFVDMDMHLAVEVHVAASFAGELRVEDPDGIVIDARFLTAADVGDRLADSPRWVAEPMRNWVTEPWDEPLHFGYRAHGTSVGSLRTERFER